MIKSNLKSYQEYISQDTNILHAPYNPEIEFYKAIQSGNIKKVEELLKTKLIDKKGLGILSTNPIKNFQYHFVITAALVSRYCIDGGLDLSTSFSLSDFFINRVDQVKTIEEIASLNEEMCLTYTKKMQELRTKKITSKPISETISYIHEHLHEKLDVLSLAKQVNLNPNYLSRLFKKEVGQVLNAYILSQKINTAKNMLLYSNYSILDISIILNFPSQSYFTEKFHKLVGLTPRKYRLSMHL